MHSQDIASRAGSRELHEPLVQRNICARILDTLDKNGSSVPIYKVAKDAGISLATASKYCHILAAQNRILMESFGNMKLVGKLEKSYSEKTFVGSVQTHSLLRGVEGSVK